MVAFIALFFPAILMTCIWLRDEVIIGRPSVSDVLRTVAVYASSVLLINFFDLLILAFLHKIDGDLAVRLNQYGSFAMKYIFLSVFIGISLPMGARAIQKGYVSFKVSFSSVSMPRIAVNAAMAAYAFILFSLNFIRIFDENYWGDEAFSINLARNPVPAIVSITANSEHPPLYYILLRAMYLLLGDHGYAYHLVSLIPLAIILVFCLVKVRKVFGTGAALFLMTMTALSANAVTYNVEIRMYSWAAMFVLLSFYELYMILQTDRRSCYFWFSLFSLGAAYSHYYALVSVAFFYMVLLAWAFMKGKKCIIRVFTASICTVLVYLPWLGVLLRTFARDSEHFWIGSIPTFGQCVRYLFSNQFSSAVLAVLAAALIWVGLCGTRILEVSAEESGGVIVSIDASLFRISGQFVWGAAGIISIAGTIVVGTCVSTIFRPLLLLRYIYPVSAVAWLLVGAALSKLKIGRVKPGNVCLAVMLVYMLTVFLPAYKDIYIQEKTSNDTLEATLNAVGDNISEESIVLTDIEHINWTIARCYFPDSECRLIGGGISGILEADRDYWLFLSKEADEPFVKDLIQEGYYYEEIIKNGVLGTHRVFVYHLVPV